MAEILQSMPMTLISSETTNLILRKKLKDQMKMKKN